MPSAGLLFCRPFDVSLSEPCEVIPGSGFNWHCFRSSRYGVYFQVLLDFKQCEYYCPPEIGFLKLDSTLKSFGMIFLGTLPEGSCHLLLQRPFDKREISIQRWAQ